MIAIEPMKGVFMFRAAFCRVGRWWLMFLSVLLIFGSAVLAHDSTSEVEAEIGSREKYLERVNQFAPAFALQDVDANPIRLKDFRGKVVILNFLYSRCDHLCPLHSLKLAEVQQQLSQASLGGQVQFITVATDNEDAVSTAESMRAHGPRYGLDPENWTFLYGGAGQEDLGFRLAAGYGLKFVPTDDGQQMHGVITYLIDTEGRLRARYHGLEFNPVNLTLHAAALVHDDHNKIDEGVTSNVPADSKALSIGLFAAFVLFVIGGCVTTVYLWKRHADGAGYAPEKELSKSAEDQ